MFHILQKTQQVWGKTVNGIQTEANKPNYTANEQQNHTEEEDKSKMHTEEGKKQIYTNVYTCVCICMCMYPK